MTFYNFVPKIKSCDFKTRPQAITITQHFSTLKTFKSVFSYVRKKCLQNLLGIYTKFYLIKFDRDFNTNLIRFYNEVRVYIGK